jgi:hypothetical protein
LLSDGEIHGILQAGGADAGVAFPLEICTAIAGIARGVPYVAQLLALHAATQAQNRGADHVSQDDLHLAFERAVEDADPGVRASFESLTRRGTDRPMLAALRAIIEGDQDRYGRFFALQNPTTQGGVSDWQVAGQAIPHDIWQRLLENNAVRACPGAGPGAFSFADPLLPHHILLRAALGG